MNKTILNNWHEIDVDGKILGRVAGEIAHLLMGKNKPEFSRSMDIGDYVVVLNAAKIKVSGKKETDKSYIHHTGYPQGFREKKLWEVRAKNPERIITHAVSGMLPQNRLKAKMLKRLYVFAGSDHPYKAKFTVTK